MTHSTKSFPLTNEELEILFTDTKLHCFSVLDTRNEDFLSVSEVFDFCKQVWPDAIINDDFRETITDAIAEACDEWIFAEACEKEKPSYN